MKNTLQYELKSLFIDERKIVRKRIYLSDIITILTTDKDTLAKWHTELNTWKWPHELKDPDVLFFSDGNARRELMTIILNIAGYSLVGKYWKSYLVGEWLPGKRG